MATQYDDSLDDLFGGTPTVARAAVAPPASYTPPSCSEACPKCSGTGRFITYTGRNLGECFTCKGKGQKTFRTSAATRQQSRDNAAARNEAKIAASLLEFNSQHSDVVQWIGDECSKTQPFAFAVAMFESLNKYGSLTDRQLETCQRLAAKAAARAQDRATAAVDAPSVDTVGVDRLRAAFDTAASYAAEKGLSRKTPKITLGDTVISPAPLSGKNPGALYVKEGTTYLGKIVDGRFHCSRECTADQSNKILAFVADPKRAAEVYGQTTGTCCVCNATLKSEWKFRGIGPVCAEKFGWS